MLHTPPPARPRTYILSRMVGGVGGVSGVGGTFSDTAFSILWLNIGNYMCFVFIRKGHYQSAFLKCF